MSIISGNTSGSIASVSFDIPCKIISGYLVNKSLTSHAVVNLYMATDNGDRSIIPYNLRLLSGAMYIIDEPIVMKAGYYLLITTNVSLDYYFSIE